MATLKQFYFLKHNHQDYNLEQLSELTGLKGSSIIALAHVHKWKIAAEPGEIRKKTRVRTEPKYIPDPPSGFTRPPAEYSNKRIYDEILRPGTLS